ncbi:hypothetical protein BC628DRAFT_152142 [Trametes gibbosa]|nr:hypothetical protein BC628DRAFT_152142 [Trametes gibbosa]
MNHHNTYHYSSIPTSYQQRPLSDLEEEPDLEPPPLSPDIDVEPYIPVWVSPLTSALHPAPPDSHTALYTVRSLPPQPLAIGMRVSLYLFAGPLPLDRGFWGQDSTVSNRVFAGCIGGLRMRTRPSGAQGHGRGYVHRQEGYDDEDIELVVKSDNATAAIRRVVLWVRAIPGVSVDLDAFGRDLACRLQDLVPRPPPPSLSPLPQFAPLPLRARPIPPLVLPSAEARSVDSCFARLYRAPQVASEDSPYQTYNIRTFTMGPEKPLALHISQSVGANTVPPPPPPSFPPPFSSSSALPSSQLSHRTTVPQSASLSSSSHGRGALQGTSTPGLEWPGPRDVSYTER